MASAPLAIVPGRSLGQINLGASLHEVLALIKSDSVGFPALDLHHSSADPVGAPVILALPGNGFRMRFDGADQRLRLIEVTEFAKVRLSYKGSELVKQSEDGIASSNPAFKRIYQIFGASYPGEYHPPKNGDAKGHYVLSWTGIAFTFPLQHSAYAPQKDHVSMLGSAAALPCTQMALFEGGSWPEASIDLFVRTPTGPRVSAVLGRQKDNLPAEIETAIIRDGGWVEMPRRLPARPFSLILNETTPQDLVTELGPPDAVHKRESDSVVNERRRAGSSSNTHPNGKAHAGSQPSSYSSTGTDTYDTDFDSGDAEEDPTDRLNRESFWCYFNHGLDILVGPPVEDRTGVASGLVSNPHLVVTKIIVHGNIPGSYAFDRHRRLRWNIDLAATEYARDTLTSEAKFQDIKPVLIQAFKGSWPESEMVRGKVVNRTWGGSPSDSSFFLPDAEEDLVEGGNQSEAWLGNTRLYTFPGLVFEVLENGAVGAVTIY